MTLISQIPSSAERGPLSPGVALPAVSNDAPATALQWTLVAERQDVLALVRAIVLLARHRRASLRLLVSTSQPGGWREGAVDTVIHFGGSPCNTLVSTLLECIGQSLNDLAGNTSRKFSVQIELPADSQPIAVHIGGAEPEGHRSR